MSKKVITLPISGRMEVAHSEKLERAICDFMAATTGFNNDDGISNGMLKAYFRLDNDICIEQRVYIRQKDYICRTILSCPVNPDHKEELLKCVQIANEINCKLDYGSFEVDTENGDIIFKSAYEPDDLVHMESLDKLVGYPRHIINKYGSRFLF